MCAILELFMYKSMKFHKIELQTWRDNNVIINEVNATI